MSLYITTNWTPLVTRSSTVASKIRTDPLQSHHQKHHYQYYIPFLNPPHWPFNMVPTGNVVSDQGGIWALLENTDFLQTRFPEQPMQLPGLSMFVSVYLSFHLQLWVFQLLNAALWFTTYQIWSLVHEHSRKEKNLFLWKISIKPVRRRRRVTGSV